MEAVESAKERCKKVIERIISQIPRRTNISDSCRRTLLKLAQSELTFLSRLLTSTTTTSLSSNIGHLEALVHFLAHHPNITGVSRVCKPIPFRRREDQNVHVDIVCLLDNLPVWVIVSDRNPKYLTWDGSNKKGESLKARIERIIGLCNSENALVARPSSVVLFFSHGLEDCLFEKLRAEFGASELEMPDELLGFDFAFREGDHVAEGGSGWVEVVPTSSRSYEEARLIEIKVGNGENKVMGLDPGRVGWDGAGLGDDAFGCLVKVWLQGVWGLDKGGDSVNFDTTALVALVSGISNGCAGRLLRVPGVEMRRRFKGNYEFVIAQVKSEIENPMLAELAGVFSGKRGIVCEAVVSEFKELVSMCGGPNEKSRADIMLRCLMIVPDSPSQRMIGLPTTRKLAMKNKIVFGTGDHWQAPTLTANMAFVRAVSQTGLSLGSIEHRPRALTGD